MTNIPATKKTLYINTDNVELQPDGEALRVQWPSHTRSLVPLRRIDRAVVQHRAADLLQACLAIVRNGGTVHFQDNTGNLCGTLQHPWQEGSQWARELAQLIEHTANRMPYRRWRDNQQRHAWSLVFRRNYCGDFESNRSRLVRYLLFFQPGIDTAAELDGLEQQLWAWLQARLDRDGLQPIVRALNDQGDSLAQTLAPCLLIPLIWAYAKWRRCNANAVIQNRVQFFELQARTRLHNQFQRHIGALGTEYRAQRQIQEAHIDDLSEHTGNHEP